MTIDYSNKSSMPKSMEDDLSRFGKVTQRDVTWIQPDWGIYWVLSNDKDESREWLLRALSLAYPEYTFVKGQSVSGMHIHDVIEIYKNKQR